MRVKLTFILMFYKSIYCFFLINRKNNSIIFMNRKEENYEKNKRFNFKT